MIAHDVAQNRLTEAILAVAYELVNFGYVLARGMGTARWACADMTADLGSLTHALITHAQTTPVLTTPALMTPSSRPPCPHHARITPALITPALITLA